MERRSFISYIFLFSLYYVWVVARLILLFIFDSMKTKDRLMSHIFRPLDARFNLQLYGIAYCQLIELCVIKKLVRKRVSSETLSLAVLFKQNVSSL